MNKEFPFISKCLIPAILLGACQTTDLHDLRLDSINMVKLSEIRGAWTAVEARRGAKTESIILLKINFSSQYDFVKLAKAKTLHLSYSAFTCDKDKVSRGKNEKENGNRNKNKKLFVLPDLRIKNFSVGSGTYSEFPDLERFRDQAGRLTYSILMPIAGDEINRLFGKGLAQGQTSFFTPSAPPDDICMQVTAAPMWFGAALQSNVVRIPAEDFSKQIN